MRTKTVVICEVCGGTKLSGMADFFVFHCLAFCSPDCLDDYQSADDERRAGRTRASAQQPNTQRSRAA